MSFDYVPYWLTWTRQLRALAQEGLTYATDPYDQNRYERLRRLAAEIGALHTNSTSQELTGLFERDTGHQTPKIDVRGAVMDEQRLLLVRERSDGGWTLPGGWADPGESPGEAVTREILEEAGVKVRPIKLIGFLDRDRHGHPPHADHIYKAIFLCVPEAKFKGHFEQLETDSAKYFHPSEIPAITLSLSRTMPAQIDMVLAHARDISAPTQFD
jgi:ADP-ribose pyrophosphatase YjhB (NUDIX family)